MRTIFITIIICCWCLLTVSTQAQESDPQKLLWDSIGKPEVSGVKTALDNGANPNWVSDTKSVIGRLADGALGARLVDKGEEKSVQILQMLFSAGGKLQPCDQKILFLPIASGWALFTEVLLRNGASLTREIDGWTPMEIAVSHGRAKIVDLLRRYGVPTLDNRIAAQLRFIRAAALGDIPGMDEAIRNGADVNEKNRRGETALVACMSFPVTTIKEYLTVQYLLETGADPTIQGEGRFGKTTALHLVIKWSSFIFGREIKNELMKNSPNYARLVIESLLRRGALVSARDSDGMTPLHIAAKYNNIVGANILIEAGSKIMPRDDNGKTPLDYAESGEMIKLLKAHGAKEE